MALVNLDLNSITLFLTVQISGVFLEAFGLEIWQHCTAPTLAVLAFANKHSNISTSLLSLQKMYSVSKSVI